MTMGDKKECIISEEEIMKIENEINEKLQKMSKLRDFFGSGHGVNIIELMNMWLEREIIPHEKRLRVKINYAIKNLPDGKSALFIRCVESDQGRTES